MSETYTIKPVVLWSTSGENQRFFLIPEGQQLASGELSIESAVGESQVVSPAVIISFEVAEEKAVRWAKEELGLTLDELKHYIDEKLADWQRQLDDFKQTPVTKNTSVTPDAGSTFFDFLRKLPQIVSDSVSGDEERLDAARKATAELEQRFNESGLPVNDRLRNFPDRMAKIHESGSTT